jgi:histidyl-tRNA synthetase
MPSLQSVTGMNDILPSESARWQALEGGFRAACERRGFAEVRTPVCEYTELFTRSVGETTDIVEKEMYTFEDRGGRSLTLRPEGTASAVRAYLNSVAGSEPTARWYYLGPMFRGERPAKGRYRQFYQLGAEVYGDAGPAVDAEIIALAHAFVRSLGIEHVDVRINSLGSGDTRERYRAALVAHFTPVKDKLSPESQRRLGTNPLRIVDSKQEQDIALRAGMPSLMDFLTPDDRKHFDAIQAVLSRLDVPVTVDPTIVRGLDYYTRTIFELKDVSGALGAQDTLVAGGRYDNLIEELGGAKTPAIGFAAGCERLLLASPVARAARPLGAAVIALAKADEVGVVAEALAIAEELRAAGITTHVDTRFGKADRQFRYADKTGARAGVVLGASELAAGTLNLKDLWAKSQRTIPRAALLAEVRALLDAPPPPSGAPA